MPTRQINRPQFLNVVLNRNEKLLVVETRVENKSFLRVVTGVSLHFIQEFADFPIFHFSPKVKTCR